jgi:hypothetical protein
MDLRIICRKGVVGATKLAIEPNLGYFSGISPFGLNRSTNNSTMPSVKRRVWAAASFKWSFSAPSDNWLVNAIIMFGPTLSTINQSQPIKSPPKSAPQLLPEPPTITITQTKNV